MRSQRIIALPMYKRLKFHPDDLMLSKPLVDQMMIYYHFNLTPPDVAKNKQSGVLNRLTTKAADTWAGFGKAPKGSWKLRLYEHGESLADRMDFEELALKGIDPSLAPPLRNPGTAGKQLSSVSQSDGRVQQRRDQEIPLIYPPSAYSELFVPTSNPTLHPSLSQLRSLLSSRKPRHRRGFYLWMLIAPLTFPFTIIPVIPNIPFFFCVWRSWSHYRAYRSSQYLSSLIDQGLVRPEPSQELDEVYRSLFHSASSIGPPVPVSTSLKNSESTGDPHLDHSSSTTTGTACDNDRGVAQQVLLTREAVPRILELFDLPESAAGDIYRAMQQVHTRAVQEFTKFRTGE